MTQIASRFALPLLTPLMALLTLALAVASIMAPTHEMPRADFVADGASAAQTTPYGSGAALRNLLF